MECCSLWIRNIDPKYNEERVINAFETRCWKRMLKIKWTDWILDDELFQREKEELLLLKILKNRRHWWIGDIIRHNEIVVNIVEGAISGKKTVGRPRLQYLKQVARNTGADSCTAKKRIVCKKSRWKAANQSKDWGIRRSIFYTHVSFMSGIILTIFHHSKIHRFYPKF